MNQLSDRFSICLILVALLSALGCSKSGGTVRGVVTIDGKPVPKGSLTFSPTGTTQGPVKGAMVTNGEYVCEEVPVGQHTVTLTAEAENYREFKDINGTLRRVPVDIMPKGYEEGLPADVKSGENKLDFPLSSKGK